MFLLVKQMFARVGMLMLPILLSGCATQLQKTLDRSLYIESRCNIVREALPIEKARLQTVFFDAVSVRLVGMCFGDGKLCDSADQPLHPIAGSAQTLMTRLENQVQALDEAGGQASEQLRDEAHTLSKQFRALGVQFNDSREAIGGAVQNLRTVLQGLKTSAQADKGRLNQCTRINDCVNAYASLIAPRQSALAVPVEQLRQQLAKLAQLAQEARRLAERAQLVLAAVPDTVKVAFKAPAQSVAEIKASIDDLEASANALTARIANGKQSLTALMTGDVADAATDFMAAQILEKGAERTLVAVDRMLGQVDRVIDKIDDQALGSATVVTSVFAGSMQGQFDRVIKHMLDGKINNQMALLSLSSAACKRLGVGSDVPVQNASIFTPFVFAVLLTLESKVSPDQRTPEQVLRDWQASADKPLTNTQMSAHDDGTKFRQHIDAAREAATEPAVAGAATASTMLEIVAKCAAVEQQLALKHTLSPPELKQSARDKCAYAANAAEALQMPMPDPGSATEADRTIAVVPPPPPPSTTIAGDLAGKGAGDAAAWREAMQAVLLASAPARPGRFDAVCKQITLQIKGSRCVESAAGRVILDFDASFALGKPNDPLLELQLAQLADILNSDPQAYRLAVDAYASRKLPPCPGVSASVKDAANCSAARNVALAQQRALWAASILQQRMGPRFVADTAPRGTAMPLSYDTPVDRRVRITLALQ